MDQIKIGKFIAERRKAIDLTQMQLAEKLNITDRAISKWETGRCMPDTSIMVELCRILKISVNDLLSGEVVTMDHYNEKSEQNLLEMAKQKEITDKQMLSLEIAIGTLSVIILLSFTAIAALLQMADWLRIVLIVSGLFLGVAGVLIALRIEQTAGYYECKICKHRYVPTYSSVLWAMHIGRSRYMRCPVCKKLSYQKKVIGKEKSSDRSDEAEKS